MRPWNDRDIEMLTDDELDGLLDLARRASAGPPPAPTTELAGVLAGERIGDGELTAGAARATQIAERYLPVPGPGRPPRPKVRRRRQAREWARPGLSPRPAWVSPRLATMSLAAKVSLGLGVAGAGVAGASAAGVLPESAGNIVRRAVEVVTPFELPDPADPAALPGEHAGGMLGDPAAGRLPGPQGAASDADARPRGPAGAGRAPDAAPARDAPIEITAAAPWENEAGPGAAGSPEVEDPAGVEGSSGVQDSAGVEDSAGGEDAASGSSSPPPASPPAPDPEPGPAPQPQKPHKPQKPQDSPDSPEAPQAPQAPQGGGSPSEGGRPPGTAPGPVAQPLSGAAPTHAHVPQAHGEAPGAKAGGSRGSLPTAGPYPGPPTPGSTAPAAGRVNGSDRPAPAGAELGSSPGQTGSAPGDSGAAPARSGPPPGDAGPQPGPAPAPHGT
jgi:hypothetical protein